MSLFIKWKISLVRHSGNKIFFGEMKKIKLETRQRNFDLKAIFLNSK